tara:strand:+ start:348 stop:710 length:363 start_codon:yes stop_codon:yes gene_type:complete
MGRSVNSFTSWVDGSNIIGGQNKLPETNMARAVLSRAFLDGMGYLNPQSSCGGGELSQLRQAAHTFINAKREAFVYICDIANADPNYVAKLYDDLIYHHSCGKLKNFNIKTIIEKLIERI